MIMTSKTQKRVFECGIQQVDSEAIIPNNVTSVQGGQDSIKRETIFRIGLLCTRMAWPFIVVNVSYCSPLQTNLRTSISTIPCPYEVRDPKSSNIIDTSILLHSAFEGSVGLCPHQRGTNLLPTWHNLDQKPGRVVQ